MADTHPEREPSDLILLGDVASPELPFVMNKAERGRKCTSCGSPDTYRVVLDEPAHPTLNEHAYVPMVERKVDNLPLSLGDVYFIVYQCEDCGHVDFYTHSERSITR